MYPYKTNLVFTRFPWATVAIVALNILVFTYEETLNLQGRMHRFVAHYGLVPAQVTVALHTAHADLIAQGSLSVMACMFMHANIWHIFLNMMMFWTLAPALEARLGALRFTGFYLASGFAACLMLYTADPMNSMPFVGASGAIGGMLGAVFVLWPRARITGIVRIIPATTNAFFFLLGFIVVQVLGVMWDGTASSAGEAVSVAYWAHIGGIVFGIIGAVYLRWQNARFPALAKRVQLPPQRPELFDRAVDWLEYCSRRVLGLRQPERIISQR